MKYLSFILLLLSLLLTNGSSQSIVVSVKTDKPAYIKGDKVNVAITAYNPADTAVRLTFYSAQQYDFLLDSSRYWSDDVAFAHPILQVTINPHQTRVWNDRIWAWYYDTTLAVGKHRIDAWVGERYVDVNLIYGSATTTFTIYPDTMNAQIILNAGWNLVSLPLRVQDNSVQSLFPHASSKAFLYDGRRFRSYDTLAIGYGYWLKNTMQNEQITITGRPVLTETVDIHRGWNILGSVSIRMSKDSIESIPSGIISRTFCPNWRSPYIIPLCDFINPGGTIWVKTTSEGKAVLQGK